MPVVYPGIPASWKQALVSPVWPGAVLIGDR